MIVMSVISAKRHLPANMNRYKPLYNLSIMESQVTVNGPGNIRIEHPSEQDSEAQAGFWGMRKGYPVNKLWASAL